MEIFKRIIHYLFEVFDQSLKWSAFNSVNILSLSYKLLSKPLKLLIEYLRLKFSRFGEKNNTPVFPKRKIIYH